MSGLSNILNIANSGLQTAQTGLRTVSDNVSNVNTPGYIRKVADQQSVAVDGRGGGVDIVAIRLAADKFLQAAGLQANAQSGAAGAKADALDQAQALFGNPNDATSFFSQLNSVFSGFAALSSDSTTATRGAALAQVQSYFDQATSISGGLRTLSDQTDSKIVDDVATANDLIKQIDTLNADISRSRVLGRDTTGAQNQQSGLVDQLSQFPDREGGGRRLRRSRAAHVERPAADGRRRALDAELRHRLRVRAALGDAPKAARRSR